MQLIMNIFSKKHIKSITRDRLSRSYYLSESAYSGDFSNYGKSFDSKIYKSIAFKSGNLIDIKKSNKISCKFKPIWYIGTHGNDFYVVIRGSKEKGDYYTDAIIK